MKTKLYSGKWINTTRIKIDECIVTIDDIAYNETVRYITCISYDDTTYICDFR